MQCQATGRQPAPECVDFRKSLRHPDTAGKYVQTVAPGSADTIPGMLGKCPISVPCIQSQ